VCLGALSNLKLFFVLVNFLISDILPVAISHTPSRFPSHNINAWAYEMSRGLAIM
jgi:hypothetical protein